MSAQRSVRRLPVRPDLTQLKHQAKDLLRKIRSGDTEATAQFQHFHPSPPPLDAVKLADAQFAIAKSYGADSWTRVVQSCALIDAIWSDDIDAIRTLLAKHPNLLHENAGIRGVNWGPPMSYAANVGRDRIVAVLHEMGAVDHQHAIGRAVLQGRIDTARLLHGLMGSPIPPSGAFGGSAYTLNVNGTSFLFEIGARLVDEHGQPDAPVDVVLQSDSRNPAAKHAILEMYATHGFPLPDTPMMALHRGRIDLLERHINRDPSLLTRTFTWDEIYPPQFRCQPLDVSAYAGRSAHTGRANEHLPRTPIAGTTLLHVCVEFDELEIARWLIGKGMSPNSAASVDPEGFGGHTPLFNAIVSYPHFWMNFTGGWAGTQRPEQANFAALLLDAGADPNPRASFCEVVRIDSEVVMHEHRNVTPLAWGAAYSNKMVVSEPAMRELSARGGTM